MKILGIIGFIIFLIIVLGINLWIELLNEKIINLQRKIIKDLEEKLAKYDKSLF